MTSTTFTGPLRTGVNNGDPQTDTIAYVLVTKIVSMGTTPVGQPNILRRAVTIPPNSTLSQMGAVPTSAFSADVSAVTVSFGTTADATRYGTVTVSALGQRRNVAQVSGAVDFDNGGQMVITCSAVSTTTYTAGGVRAFVTFNQANPS